MKNAKGRADGAKVLVMMGSDSDLEIMRECTGTLKAFGVAHKVVVASAHRSLERVISIVGEAEKAGVKVIIAAAGGAAHLAGVVAGMTVVPVIGVPCASSPLSGVDALYSTVQMPPGVPVACVGVNGSRNAALLAIAILAQMDPDLRSALVEYRAGLAKEVELKHERVEKLLNNHVGSHS
ncbi:MAG: 5-(carboxyamino)imidazole ribonucleotide mutase [Bacillota bacterium]|jgi:phosphoribosylaminoimidazole carboxylase PurE protein|nr:5-(carboxyamino)imidazole ribonucleotide mutase [Bacillota bacterium]MDI9415994.1 5-(carboxyamino)imidazole ribonucleotide mutase [Bacillota bacterium]NLD12644.1 5-(carboxyamino)imidazole ribonucleotide mutase [Bacillota bacterium]HAV20961.1 5-(carboxyamino)imidazole ribonucleotide mutase [Bacillota bacterium]HCD41583.1 5-(carboxyamino)imidazole ribonucleotide mutase [Bacillota bacterium]